MEILELLNDIKKQIKRTKTLEFVFEFEGKKKTVFAKSEFENISGSVKIRPAFQIIYDAYLNGELHENQKVVEVTSGNMGISLAYICNLTKNPITILMPKTMSKERVDILKNMGAEVVLTDDFLSAFNLLDKYKKEGYYLPLQFDNPSNTNSQRELGQEIYEEIGHVDAFVSGVGTGGTLIGCGGFLKEKTHAKLIALDPEESKLLSCGKSLSHHKIQGLSDEIIPSIYEEKMVDEIVNINSDDAIVMARKIREKFGIGIGISSGCNLLGSVLTNQEIRTVSTVLSDDDSKYLSTDLTNPKITSKLVEKIKFISCKIR